MSDDVFDDQDIAESTYYVLGVLGALFAATAIFVVFRLLPKSSRQSNEQPIKAKVPKQKQTRAQAVKDAQITSASETEADPQQPRKPGVSLKQLVKQSNQASSRQPAADKPVDHPLYLSSLKGIHADVMGISVSPAGDVAVVTEDSALKVFNVQDLTAKTFSSHRASLTKPPIDVAFGSPTEVFVLVEGNLGRASLKKYSFQMGKFEEEWTVAEVHGREAGKGLRAGVTQHGRSVALSYSDQTDLEVYDQAGRQLASINASGLKNHSAALSAQARFCGAATFTSDVKLHEIQLTREGDFSKAQKVMDLKKVHMAQVYCLAFSPDGRLAATASKDGTWAVWNIDVRYSLDEDPKVLVKSQQQTGTGRYTQLAFGPRGVIAAAFNKTLHFLDSKQGTLLEEIEEAHEDVITAIEWSPAQHKYNASGSQTALLITAGMDKRARLWRAPIT